MRHELLRAKAMNKAFVDLSVGGDLQSPDSVMLQVADWYDRHGTPNERMEAHYLLGCTYRDMGEAPRAVDCYLDAAACADTTAADCDFHLLGCVYSQMGELYHHQLLLSYEIESEKRASHFFYMAKDTANAVFLMKKIAGAMILQNKRDYAEQIINDVIRHNLEKGNELEAIQASTMLMHLYLDMPGRQTELKRLIDSYDSRSELFNEKHELPPSAGLFNYYKGKYFENVGQLDSAEYYYRKVYSPQMFDADKIPLFRGLFSVFAKKKDADSTVKYAWLYCDVNDSSIALKDQAITAQMTASYNYNHYQKEAQRNERKAHRTELLLIALGVVLCVVIAAGIYAARLYKCRQQKKRKVLEEKHRRKVEQLRESHRQELARLESLFLQKEGEQQRMEDIYHKVTETIRQELESAKSENLNMRENYTKARMTIEEINAHYEKDKATLNEEIRQLKLNIAELKKRMVFTDSKEMSSRLLATSIVTSLKSRADIPNKVMTQKESEELLDTFRQFFPLFVQDMKLGKGLNKTDEVIAMLTALGLKPGQIQYLTDLTSSRITNSKTKMNKVLFADNSAPSLYNNLVLRYGI